MIDECLEIVADERLGQLLVPVVVSVSFRLTDMGNGVDRVEGWARVPFDEAVAGANEVGAYRLPQPVPHKIRDAMGQVLGTLGVKVPAGPEPLIDGYVRLAGDRSLDVVAWAALLV